MKAPEIFVKKDWLRNQKAKIFGLPPLARVVDFLYLCVWKYFQENAQQPRLTDWRKQGDCHSNTAAVV